MVTIKNKQILIDDKPVMIMCGEIHYFRLKREDWQDRINKLKDAGLNTIASYVPWLCHETIEGNIDLTGQTRPELDLLGFIDLCKQNGLYFFLRPGPFIMAEIKNEGIPFWVYEKHPELVPITWDGVTVPTKTLDYLAPSFLAETKKWYKAVMDAVKPRLQPFGGNIIGIQLDNEIGMLSWVSNSPDLTDYVIDGFGRWLRGKYEETILKLRYPFDLDDKEALKELLQSPSESYVANFTQDLGYYMRSRFSEYVAILRSFAEESGIEGVPYIINIHGTSGGRAFTYPIGISQLYEAYTQAQDYLSGSDIYLGDLSMNNFQDLYIINGFMDSVNLPDQPLTSLEFECGDGNYGSNLGGRYDPSAADFKTRMCIAQGNRMLNYYLFTGGINYVLDPKPNDGNGRIAFTGERHGFAAPVSPEGELNYTYPRMARTIRSIMALADNVAVMEEEHDNVSFAFIPDYFMTEYRYPKSNIMKEMFGNIEANRGGGAWEIVGRAMLLTGYRFSAVDIQNKEINPDITKVLVLSSARYMHGRIQKKLADYLYAGGNILLYGEVPLFDMEGIPCRILADALGVKITGCRTSEHYHYLSVRADGWASTRPEVRSNYAQTFELGDQQAILRTCDTGEVCGFESSIGKGKAIVIAAAYECDIMFFKTILEKLSANASLTHDCPYHGIFMTSTASKNAERFLHILNLDGFEKKFRIKDKGEFLFDGHEFLLGKKDGVMLPLNLRVGNVTILYSTSEVIEVKEDSISFRLTQTEDVIAFAAQTDVKPSQDYKVDRQKDKVIVKSCKHFCADDCFTVHFGSLQ